MGRINANRRRRKNRTAERILYLFFFVFLGAVFFSMFLTAQDMKKRNLPPELPSVPQDRHSVSADYFLPALYCLPLLRACDETGVPVWLACRLFKWESGWDEDFQGKINEDGTVDLGLGGLNSRYLEYFAEMYNDGKAINPFDPKTNISVSLRYLAHLKLELGEWRGAVAAYNCGLGRYKSGDLPAITQRHVAYIIDGRRI